MYFVEILLEITFKNKSNETILINNLNFKDKFVFFNIQDKKIGVIYEQKSKEIARKNEDVLIEIPISDFSSSQVPFYLKSNIFQKEDIIIFL